MYSVQQRQELSQVGFKLADPQLKDLIVNKGIGFHHAGLDQNDRLLIESLFLNGHLFVLCKFFIPRIYFRERNKNNFIY